MDRANGELRVRRLPGETREVVAFCASLPGPTRVAYEAGPTGFALSRALAAVGIECVIAAPGKIERPSSDRVKTDQRDAERLLRLLMIDGLHPVRVPSTQEEALRDLVRAREDIRGDLMRARHRMSKLLLRHDVRFDGTAAAWTTHHRRWLAAVDLGDRGAQAAFMDYLGAIDALLIRRDTLEATIAQLIPASPWADTIARLRCLRGIDTLSAVGLCAEIGDWQRFAKAGQVMSYLGLVPSEDTTAPDTAAGRDHQDRQRARPPALGRSGLALPPRTAQQRGAQAPPGRTAGARHRDQLAGAAPAASHLAAPGRRARQAPHDRGGRRRARARRLLLGRGQRRLTPASPRQSRRRREPAGTSRARASAVPL
jgi:transposase